MLTVNIVYLVIGLIIVARLIELQVVRGAEYRSLAYDQHHAGISIPARRGEIFAKNSKTGDLSILATNTTLDLVYVDPYITEDPPLIAETLSDLLVSEEIYSECSSGGTECPRELVSYFSMVYDPLERIEEIDTDNLLEPLPLEIPTITSEDLVDLTELRRLFARDIEKRISEKRVTFVPLLYGATKVQLRDTDNLDLAGVTVSHVQNLIYANPEQVPQGRLSIYAKRLSPIIDKDVAQIRRNLRSRPLRYVPVMRQIPPAMSAQLKELFLSSLEETQARKAQAPTRQAAERIHDPLRSIALIPEHWRYYPDGSTASHVMGFMNTLGEAQYGIERTFHAQLRGQEGLISTLSDPSGGQILSASQTIKDPKDGDAIVLTIDRFVQRRVEEILADAIKEYDADSGQVIVLDPKTGRILALANAPLFDSNNYGDVFDKEPVFFTEQQQREIVVELYHPDTLSFIMRGYYNDLFSEDGRSALKLETRQAIAQVEQLYDLPSVVRYYHYSGENSRREVFPTHREGIWLRYENNIGVGAYINRAIQEIYEPGSVMKAVTMAVALDQGEITPDDLYQDDEPVEVDEYTIRNALNNFFGEVTMTNCLEYSINTCMTSVSMKLGKKLFFRMLEQFGFGRITGIELDDELPGEILPWRKWSQALLATAAYGQGISATPLQMVTAIAALANGGTLMKPMVIDSIVSDDGSVRVIEPIVIDRVIKRETAETITAMLTSTVTNGYAKTAKVPGYLIAGKTGTSQIAGPGGRYETGTGSAITSFAGYAPVFDPRFAMLVKIDRPRNVEFGSESAAPVFKDIAAFLLDYYGVEPDEEG